LIPPSYCLLRLIVAAALLLWLGVLGAQPVARWVAGPRVQGYLTASCGTVSEPCNHLKKFPHPQIPLLNRVQGASALEAYWRSVAWPVQGMFLGELLAAPFVS
jgi:hypothetical protein